MALGALSEDLDRGDLNESIGCQVAPLGSSYTKTWTAPMPVTGYGCASGVPAAAVALLRVTEGASTAAPTGGASAKTLELAPTGTRSCLRFRLGGHEALPPGSTLLSPAVEVHVCSRPRPRSRSRSRTGALRPL